MSASHVGKNENYQRLHAEAALSGLSGDNLPILTGPRYFPPDARRDRTDRRKCKTGLHPIKENVSVIEASVVQPENDDSLMLSVTDSLLNTPIPDVSLNVTVDSCPSKIPVSACVSRSVSPAPSRLDSESHQKPRRHAS